jgi:signal transduction histidine kinase
VALQPVLNEVIKLGRSIIPSNIEIRHEIQETCGTVLADATQMHQIAMNLMINSYHAMESGGEIHILLEERALDIYDVANMPLPPGRYARISVSDTGCGIDPAIIDKIFDPYFTTKPQDRRGPRHRHGEISFA